jgi:hypothetical protein
LIINADGEYETVKLESADRISAENTALRTVYQNGEILIDDNLEAIRQRTHGK